MKSRDRMDGSIRSLREAEQIRLQYAAIGGEYGAVKSKTKSKTPMDASIGVCRICWRD
jgi:hypothetical protein